MNKKIISSRDNPFFKALKKLATSSRERNKSDRTLLDGAHLVSAYAQAFGAPEKIVVTPEASGNAEIQALLRAFPAVETVELSAALLREISPVESPNGIVAVIPVPHLAAPLKPSFCVLLEDIQDPGNLGSILRSAAAAGVEAAYLSRQCADAWSPKVLRGGMGAHFSLAILECADLIEVARRLDGLVIATSLDAECALFDLDLRGPAAFIVGNEGAGLSAELRQAANKHVVIPMPGNMESINVAAATAICLFEKVRQQHAKI